MRKYQVRFRGGITEKGPPPPRRYPTRHQRWAKTRARSADGQPPAPGFRGQQSQRLLREDFQHLGKWERTETDAARFL